MHIIKQLKLENRKFHTYKQGPEARIRMYVMHKKINEPEKKNQIATTYKKNNITVFIINNFD